MATVILSNALKKAALDEPHFPPARANGRLRRPAGHRPSEEQKARIIDSYKAGNSAHKVARLHGFTPSCVYGVLARAGVERRRPGTLTEKQKDAVCKARAEGALTVVLARRYRVTHQAISKIVSKGRSK